MNITECSSDKHLLYVPDRDESGFQRAVKPCAEVAMCIDESHIGSLVLFSSPRECVFMPNIQL